MWTAENRDRYNRDHLRYPSDLTDEEWSLIGPLIPPAKRGGRRRSVDIREVVNGLLYILSTGCAWRYVPKDLPPKSTLFEYFDLWTYHGVIDRIHHALYMNCRKIVDREASPTPCVRMLASFHCACQRCHVPQQATYPRIQPRATHRTEPNQTTTAAWQPFAPTLLLLPALRTPHGCCT